MKVVVLFGVEKPKKEEAKKFSVLVDELVGKLLGDTDVDWYLVGKEEVENIEKGIERGELNKDINTSNKFR